MAEVDLSGDGAAVDRPEVERASLPNAQEVPTCTAASASDTLQHDVSGAVLRSAHIVPGVSCGGERLAMLLRYMNPYCSESERDQVVRVVHRETGGSEDGLALVDDWYRRRTDYPGKAALSLTWLAVKPGEVPAADFGLLCQLVDSYGFNSLELCAANDPDFEPCAYTIEDHPGATVADDVRHSTLRVQGEALMEMAATAKPQLELCEHEGIDDEAQARFNPLQAYSLRGHIDELRKLRLEEKHVIPDLVLAGQMVVDFAESNTGKTLLTIWQITQAINSGHVNPSNVFYMNADDSLNGLLEKAAIAERYGFHMIGDGFRGFQARDFPRVLKEITEQGYAHGVVLIVDTVKKVTDVMDKRVCTAFGDVVRRFVIRGGTAILLAHTNKHPSADGRPVPGGTSDLRQDADTAYTIRTISEPGAARKVVEYENIKRRGDVCPRAAFSYSTARGLTYEELLGSVQRVEDDQVVALEVAADRRADDPVIQVVRLCIHEGIVKRMDLVATTAQRSKCGRRKAEVVLDKYTGDDPLQHHWTYDVQARGAKVYRLLELVEDAFGVHVAPTPPEPGHE